MPYEYGPYRKTLIKLNYNCPESEKSGSGPGSCSGSSGNAKDSSNQVDHHNIPLEINKSKTETSFKAKDSGRRASVSKDASGDYTVTLDDGKTFSGRSESNATTMAKNYTAFGYKYGSKDIADSPQKKSVEPSAANPKVSSEQVRRMMPSGATYDTDGWNWSKRGGFAGEKSISKTRQKLEDGGWTPGDSKDSHSADGGVINKQSTLVSPDGLWEASFDKSYGQISADNRFGIRIRRKT